MGCAATSGTYENAAAGKSLVAVVTGLFVVARAKKRKLVTECVTLVYIICVRSGQKVFDARRGNRDGRFTLLHRRIYT